MSAGRIAVGHPVDVASGAVFTIAHDFELPGTLPLVWRRHYATGSATDSWLGPKWSNPYFVTLVRKDQGFVFKNEEGSTALFPIHSSKEKLNQSITNFGANMQLQLSDKHAVILHWHNGDDEVNRIIFKLVTPNNYRFEAYENLAGHRISVKYDSAGRPYRICQKLENRVLELNYNDENLLVSVTLISPPNSPRVLAYYEYKERLLASSVNALGAKTEYTYNNNGHMTSETGELGATFSFVYDKLGRCVYTSGDNGYMERSLKFDVAQRATRVINSLGEVTSYYCNPTGQVLQVVAPNDAVTAMEYDEHGRIVSVTLPDGGTNRCSYDEFGNRSTITDAMGNTTYFTYNEFHQPTEVTGPHGDVTKMGYDTKGCLMTLTNALGHQWKYTRDQRGIVISAESPSGLILHKHYGAYLRPYEVRDTIGKLRRVEFDSIGNPTAIYDSVKLLNKFEYDPCGRVVRIEMPDGRFLTFSWNHMDQLVERTGPSGERDIWEYDAFGQLTAHIDPLGNQQSLSYDTEGRLTKVINRVGEATKFTYDMTGNISQETTFDGRIINYKNDMAGYPVEVNEGGRWIKHIFDLCGQMKTRETSDGLRQDYAYDPDGRILEARTGKSSVTFKRNLLGQVIEEQRGQWIIVSEYDEEGRRVLRRVKGHPQYDLNMEYDFRGRPTFVENANLRVLEWEWDQLDRPVRRSSLEKLTEHFSYDNSDRLVSNEASIDQRLLYLRKYAWDKNHQLVQKTDNRQGVFDYIHDAIGRLIEVNHNGHLTESYRYDANGSILETNKGMRDIAGGGRIIRTEKCNLRYDTTGCATFVVMDAKEMHLRYDGENQLSEVNDTNGMDTAYEYDALGRRISKTVNGARTEFIWDGCELLGEAREGKLKRVVFHEKMEPRILWHEEERYCLVSDAAGIAHEMIGEDGRVHWEASFNAFGIILSQSGSPASPFRFRGQYFDEESGFCYNFRRYYYPETQNFLTPDSLGIEAGGNPYEYPRNPIDWDDPFGLRCTNRHRERMAERRMDRYYRQRGYKRITQPPTSRSRTQGIDAVYYRRNGNPRYIIAEAKYGTNDLHMTRHSGEQMSNRWINDGVAGRGPARLEEAVGERRATIIRDAADQGLVRRDIFYAPEGAPREVFGAPYTAAGPGSQSSTAGPITPIQD